MFFATNKNGDEFKFKTLPEREGEIWVSADESKYEQIPTGFLERYVGKKVGWNDEPASSDFDYEDVMTIN